MALVVYAHAFSQNLAHPTPTGVVELTLVGADKLRKADLTGGSLVSLDTTAYLCFCEQDLTRRRLTYTRRNHGLKDPRLCSLRR